MRQEILKLPTASWETAPLWEKFLGSILLRQRLTDTKHLVPASPQWSSSIAKVVFHCHHFLFSKELSKKSLIKSNFLGMKYYTCYTSAKYNSISPFSSQQTFLVNNILLNWKQACNLQGENYSTWKLAIKHLL